MSSTVTITLIGWIPVSILLFVVFTPRRALLITVFGGWLSLPFTGFTLPGLPEYDKFTAIALGAVAGTMLCDPRSLLLVRPRWFDVPALVLCLSPFITSMYNGLGTYDGLSEVWSCSIIYAVPYLLGRAYFNTPLAMRELSVAVVLGAVVYIPLCLFEVRMSPQLNNIIYGFHPDSFGKVYRLFGYRPVVFLGHGITVGMWMAMGAVVTTWLWRSNVIRHIAGVPVPLFVIGQIVLMPMWNAFAGIMLMLAGVGTIIAKNVVPLRVILSCLMLVPPIYVGSRVLIGFEASEVVEAVSAISEARGHSLGYRIDMENKLMDRAWESPFWGWGGWGRSRPDRQPGSEGLSVPDSLWILAFGQRGLVGLFALWLFLLLPGWLCVWRSRGQELIRPVHGAVGALTVVAALFAIDCTINSKINPVYFMIVGALASYQASGWFRAARGETTRALDGVVSAVPVRRPADTESSRKVRL